MHFKYYTKILFEVFHLSLSAAENQLFSDISFYAQQSR